jgi:hypothetical protein
VPDSTDGREPKRAYFSLFLLAFGFNQSLLDKGELFSRSGIIWRNSRLPPALLYFQTIFQAFKRGIKIDSVTKFTTIGDFFSLKL